MWLRASDFSCSCKKSNQKNTPLGVALRASRERSAYGKAVPTQRRVAMGLNRPSMACLPHLRHSVHGDPKTGKGNRKTKAEIQIRAFGTSVKLNLV